MQLSIVIPAKNEAKTLPRLLKAIQAQEGVELEVIVADAGSTDETRSIAEQFGARVVDGGLPGPGRNAGARIAAGEWICFHDADVVPLSSMYYQEALMRFAQRRAVVGTTQFIPEKRGFKNVVYHWLYHLYAKWTAYFIPHAAGSGIFVRREWHERVQGFDETVVFAEDMEYVQRIVRSGGRFAYLSQPELQVSVRRLERDGYLMIAWRYLRAEWYMRWHGPIRKELFPYEFTYPTSQT